jgi:hypothetical protein
MGARGLVLGALVGSGLACSELVGFDDLQRTGAETRDAGDGEPPSRDGGGPGLTRENPPETDGAVSPSGRCDPTKPFGSPEVVAGLNPPRGTSTGLAFSPNELEAVYGVFVDSTFSIRHARRTSLDAPWAAVDTPLPRQVGSPSSMSADGLSLYTTLGPTENFVLKRTSTAGAFTSVLSFETSAVAMADPAFFVSSSEERAYFSISGAAAGEALVAFVPLSSSRRALAGSPTQLRELHLAGANDAAPILNPAETVIYFQSVRPGVGSVSLRASRAAKTDPFGAAEPIGIDGTNTFIWWISNDDCELHVFRNDLVQLARRPPR